MTKEFKKKGRPRKEDARNYHHTLRLSSSDVEKIRYLETETGKSVSEILREGIKIQYNLQRCKEYTD